MLPGEQHEPIRTNLLHFKRVKILHTSDLHFRKDWFDWMTSHAKDFDACCLSGDLLDLLADPKPSLATQIRWVSDWLSSFPARLCVCSGNHDYWRNDERFVDRNAGSGWLLQQRRPGLLVDGDTKVMDGYLFACKPWIGPVELPAGCPVVLLAHGPPEGTAVSSDLGHESGDFETTALVRQLPEKSIVLSGHVHNPSRWHLIGRVTFFNPGFAGPEQDAPNHIVIDLERREAEFFGWGRHLGPVRF